MKNTDIDEWLSEVKNNWQEIPSYTVKELKHLAVICDGNRRAAEKRGLNPWLGHRIGIEVIKGIGTASLKWGVKHLTFWVWSTENWKREEGQVSFVMNLAAKFLDDSEIRQMFQDNKAKFVHLGRKDRLPEDVLDAVRQLEEETKGFTKRYLNLALDYGGLDEIARAFSSILKDIEAGKGIKAGMVDEDSIEHQPELIFDYLDTSGQPEVDLVVRTGTNETEMPHTSGFLPLQSRYASWAFVPTFFPDLTPRQLLEVIQKFEGYERRMGR